MTLIATSQAANAQAPSTDEAGCDALPPALAREGADWRQPARALRAGAGVRLAPVVTARERVSLTLLPAADADLAVEPRRDGGMTGGYAGFVAFRTGAAGAYRVSLDDRAWIEVVTADSSRPSVVTQSDKRMRCFGVGKNLAFELAADTLYAIQVSGASRPGVGLMVSPPAQ